MKYIFLLLIMHFASSEAVFAQYYIVPDSTGWVVDFSKPPKEFSSNEKIDLGKPLNENMCNEIISSYLKVAYMQHMTMMQRDKRYRKSKKEQFNHRTLWNKRVTNLQQICADELKKAKHENREPVHGTYFCVTYGDTPLHRYLACQN